MFKVVLLAMLVSFGCAAHWEDVTPLPLSISGNSSYFNASVTTLGNQSFEIESHTNPQCEYKNSSPCRKGLVSYNRNKYDESKVRRHSFTFELNQMKETPDFLIIYQDWVRIHADDSNGNPPITTLKIKNVNGKLYLQHWDNAWQWQHTPLDYDQHLVEGMERMNGEIEINKNCQYSVEIYTQDFSGTGRTFVKVNGTVISDVVYKASHLTEHHSVMTGMYWSKGFNKEHEVSNNLKANFSNVKHEVLRINQ